MTDNIIPREMVEIATPWGDNSDQALKFGAAYLRNLPMLQFVYSAVNPIPVKSLMRSVGLPAGPLRRLFSGLDDAALRRGLDIVRKLGLDAVYGLRDSPVRAAE